jgi:uncharacterized protein (UPF0264 family)
LNLRSLEFVWLLPLCHWSFLFLRGILTMTRLLVSVRNADEAQIALAGGADVIDVKEPRRGALGPADPEVWRAIGALVGGRAVTSVALGELLSDPVEALAKQSAGFGFAKIGLAGCRACHTWKQRWEQATAFLPRGTLAVPVAYADRQTCQSPAIDDVLRLAAAAPARLLLIDTHDKTNGRLLDHLPFASLARIVDHAREIGVAPALAGSLSEQDLLKLLELSPAYLGVRGAACRGGRDGRIDLARVKSLASIVHGKNKKEASCCLTTPRARRILPSR